MSDLLADLRAVMAEATAGPMRVVPRDPGDNVTAAYGRDSRGPAYFDRDEDADAYVALRNAWPRLEAMAAQAEADRAELLEWRSAARREVVGQIEADATLAAALSEARAELERLRRVEVAADALHDAFERWYSQTTSSTRENIDAWDAPGGVGDADRAYREARGKR